MTDPTFAGWQRRLRNPTAEDLSLRDWGPWKECTEAQAKYAQEHGHPLDFSMIEAEVRPVFTKTTGYDPSKLRDTHTVTAQQATYARGEAADLNIHTIMTIWEALDIISGRDGTPSSDLRANVGTAELRDLCITLSDYVEHVYHIASGGDDFRMDHIAFDWDFVPWLLGQLDWSSATGSPIVIENMISAEEMAKRALEAFPRT